MATLSVYDTPFHQYAHRERASAAGFTSEDSQRGFSGRAPENLTAEESVVYKLSLVIAKTPGLIPQEEFTEALKVMSREKIVALVHIVWGYFYVSKLAGIGDDEVPAAAKAF